MLSTEERRGLGWTLIGGGALALTLLVWLGFFRDSAPTPPATAAAESRSPVLRVGSVRGRIVDANHAFGLAARTVEVSGVETRSDHYLVPASATSPGAFEVRALPAGTIVLRMSADGYVHVERSVEITAGRVADLGTVALVPLATLVGRVVDRAGAGIGAQPGAVVLRCAGREVARAATDEHAEFRFDRLDPALYELEVPASTGGDSTLAPTLVDARRGGECASIELEVSPSIAFTGRLLLPIGSAPARALTVANRRVDVGGDGRFAVDDLRAGPCVATIELDDGRLVSFSAVLPSGPVEWRVDSRVESHADETTAPADAPLADAPPVATELPPPVAIPAGDGELRVRVRAGEVGGVATFLRFARVDAPDQWFAQALTTRGGEARVRDLPCGVALRVEALSGRWRGVVEATLVAGVAAEARIVLAEDAP